MRATALVPAWTWAMGMAGGAGTGGRAEPARAARVNAAFLSREELLQPGCCFGVLAVAQPAAARLPKTSLPSLKGALPRLAWLSCLEASALPDAHGMDNRTGTILEEPGDGAA